jgi:polyisoprenoid-binding protein YceI
MNWNIDQTHSEVQFKVKHLVISTVTGNFTNYEGSVVAASEDSFDNAAVTFSLDVASISTNQIDRDNHLKSTEFFDVEKFPKITFSNGVLTKKNNDDYELNGHLTLKETTKPVTLQVTLGGIMKDPWGNTKAGFEINGIINRKDFGMTWNAVTEAGGLLVAEDIKLALNIQLAKA